MRALVLATAAMLCTWGSPRVSAQGASVWTRVEGGPGTGCSHDSSFAFFVHHGDPRRVMVFLEGGGACWNGRTCDLKGDATFSDAVRPAPSFDARAGILDVTNPANPVRDYSIVSIPYCTGDVHLGARDVTYRDSLPRDAAPRTFMIRHQGARNVASVLAWVTSQWKDPAVVFVAGGSAGAIPSPVYAAQLSNHYRNARVLQLGDGAGGYRTPRVAEILAGWGVTERLRRDPAYQALDSARLSFEALYVAASKAAPRVRFAQVNYAADETQVFFLDLLGHKNAVLKDLMRENLADIRRGSAGFRSYTAPGNAHTSLTGPEFYTLRVDNVTLRDWVANLLDGQVVADVGAASLR